MDKFFELINGFNYFSVALRLVLAIALGGFIGSERGRHGRAAGLRTHVLICVGAALTALTGLFGAEVSGNAGDMFRISAQVISGIGFLGVGTILVRNNSVVTGLTTAAGLWTTAAIGIALGYGFYFGSLVATAICFFTATALNKLERGRKNVIHFYAELDDIKRTSTVVDEIRKFTDVTTTVDITSPKSSCSGHVGLIIFVKNTDDAVDYKAQIESLEGVCFAVEENG